MECKFKEDELLSYSNNKQRFVDFLSIKLRRCDYVTRHANKDFDTLIESTALESAVNITTMLVGNDTDLLFCYNTMSIRGSMEGCSFMIYSSSQSQRKFCVEIFNKPKLN